MNSTDKFAPIAALMNTDAYKLDHRRQYGLAGNVTRVYSNYTNRKSRIKGMDHVVHFGLQAYIAQLEDSFMPFFEADENEVADLYFERVAGVLGRDTAAAIGVDHIRSLHRRGYLPVVFKGVPEGTLVPIRIPSFTVENTLDEFFWLTNYLETGISAAYWAPSTSATIAHAYRVLLDARAERTGAPASAVDFQLHDFSFRGMSSHASAAASGAAHLLSFSGTDSLVSLEWIDKYYSGDYTAMSVAATEHSVMSTGIATLGEGESEMLRALMRLYPSGILSVVSDTFDLWKVLTQTLPELKDRILARDGKLVIRPDSGDPVKILCGNAAGRTEPERLGVVQLLWNTFGGTYNNAGYRELDPHIGAIYGDSITIDRADEITHLLQLAGYASTNVVFGVGSFTYQYNTRDTFGSAMKATWAKVDGKSVNLFKDPITDDGTKKSATGRLAVFENDGKWELVEKAQPIQEASSLLQPVWKDGYWENHQTFEEVREVLAKSKVR